MRRAIRIVLVAGAAVVCAAPHAHAQARVGVLAYATFGSRMFAAKDTFKAVSGRDHETLIAGGVDVVNVWKGLFAGVGFSQTKVDGQRVFVNGSDVFPLGIPLRITIRPIDVGAGWRVQRGRLSPFAGGGATFVSYTEAADFAEAGDDVDERRTGGLVFAGVDYALIRWLSVGGEVRYRTITGILGKGGASQAFNEKDLGGIDVGVRVSVGR